MILIEQLTRELSDQQVTKLKSQLNEMEVIINKLDNE